MGERGRVRLDILRIGSGKVILPDAVRKKFVASMKEDFGKSGRLSLVKETGCMQALPGSRLGMQEG